MSIEYDVKFVMVPIWLIDSGVSAEALKVLCVLGTFVNNDSRKAWPSRASIAEKCGSSPSTVDRAIKELREKGAISTVHRRSTDTIKGTNIHTLHLFRPGSMVALDVETPSSPVTRGIVTHDETPSSPMTNELRSIDLDLKEVTKAPSLLPKQILTVFDVEWTRHYRKPYLFLPKDPKLAKALKDIPLTDIKQRVVRYLRDSTAFYKSHPFRLFVAHYDRFSGEGREPGEYIPSVEELREQQRRKREADPGYVN